MQFPEHNYKIGKQEHEKRNNHKSFVIWLTGLSGSGKSTIASQLNVFFHNNGMHSFILDGDIVRKGLSSDLDFSKEGRKENIRRISEVANLFCQAGVITITAFISPYTADRENAKAIIGSDNFFEVFVDASLECCMQRDVKGLYKKALDGAIKNFTGIDDIYERPANPFIHLHTESETPEQSVDRLVAALKANKLV